MSLKRPHEEMTCLKNIGQAREFLNPKDVEVIIYHHPCSDGFGSAYVAWSLLKDKAEYVGFSYGKQSESFNPETYRGKNVLMIDVSVSLEKIQALNKVTKTFLLLDHHKSAESSLQGTPGCYFEMERSGVGLAWEYFFNDEPMPIFLQYIQDRDLWTWKLPDTKPFTAIFYNIPLSFEEYQKYNDWWKVQEAIGEGRIVNKLMDDSVKKEAEQSCYKMIGDWKVSVLNTRNNISEVGHVMAMDKNVKFAAIFYWDGEHFRVSLRSDGRKDVSEVAAEYGGGGHHNAAGFVWKDDINKLFKPIYNF